MTPATSLRTAQSRPGRAAWILLLLVQVVMALTPLAEARGGAGAGAHIESRSDARHYVHAEANCAFCAVRTIHAAIAGAAPKLPRGQNFTPAVIALAQFDPSTGAVDSNLSRAPPRS